MKKQYLTTSIAYTNAPPHIGFSLELVQTDVYARYLRSLNKEVFFLTGTDEHGEKIAKAAYESGKTPQEFCDEISQKFQKLTNLLNISNTDFIRTTDKEKHWPGVYKLWEVLEKKGDIYKKEYEGLYCIGCETFLKTKDLINGKCIYHAKEPESVKEENYFFKLSKYAPEIKRLIEKDEIKIIPQTRKKEMLFFLRQGLEDVSFSRPKEKVKWGIPVLKDKDQLIYCWADALTNYITGIGYARDEKTFKQYWPADVHFIGKDILRFHSLIWPGMLLSLGIDLPKTIFVHGFITSNGQKMSKSLGNVIDPFHLIEKYGSEATRYFLLREIPSDKDGDFTYEKFESRYNSDLASGLGNLVSRVFALYDRIKDNEKQNPNNLFKKEIEKTKQKWTICLDNFKFSEALMVIWQLISFCDKYLEEKKPWENKQDKETINNLVLAIENISELIKPFLPETSEKILLYLKGQRKPLFPRIN